MRETTIGSFGWGVSDEYDDEDESNPDRKLVQRTLHVTVLAQLPAVGPDGEPLSIAVEVMHLPFGNVGGTRPAWELLEMAMRGEEPPPRVDVVQPGSMLGHRGPNGVPRG